MSTPLDTRHQPQATDRRLPATGYRLLLWALVLILFVALMSCAAGSKDGNVKSDESTQSGETTSESKRFLLGGSTADDSAAVAAEFFVDQVIRQVLDSIPGASYVTMNVRDSLAREAKAKGNAKGVELAELGKRLDLDGVIFTRVARFGGLLALDVNIVEPSSGKSLYRNVVYSLIRYRDSTGALLVGPALHDAARKALSIYMRRPYSATRPVASEPIVMGAIVIGKEPGLGKLAPSRGELSRTTMLDIAAFAARFFPTLVIPDPGSRDMIYSTVGIKAAIDYEAVAPLERQALFNLGIDRYLSGSITPVAPDSLHFRIELRQLTGASSEALVESVDTVLLRKDFETTRMEETVALTFVGLVEPILAHEAERLKKEYEEYLKK